MLLTKHDTSTKNDLAEGVRTKVGELLQARLADSLALQLQCKQAHWNVKGPHFIGLHKLFDDVYADVVSYTDEIAERLVQLGGTALGTAPVITKQTKLDEYPLDITRGEDHVDALSSALAAFGKHCRKAIEQSDDMGDAVTADMFTRIVGGVDKWLWFVEAHQQSSDAE